MASTIIQRVIGGVNDNAIQLDNSAFGRLITIPTTWSKIRVGIRFHSTDSGANIGGTPRFALGFGSGVTNLVNSATCTHFVGIITNWATWVRAATYYSTGSATLYGCKKIGNVITLSPADINSGTPYIGNGAALGTADRMVLFADITKGAPNYNFEAFYPTAIAVADVSVDLFLNAMEAPLPVIGTPSHQYTAAGGSTVAVDEATDGVLNSIQCWWNQANPVMEISDVAWAVIA